MIVSGTPVRPAVSSLRRLAGFWLDVVFPPVCARCGRTGFLLCAECQEQMPHSPERICSTCGRFLDATNATPADSLCRECVTHPPLLTQMRAPLRYLEPTSDIIHRFKYEGYFALAEPLANLMIEGWPRWRHAPDLIQPIPLHPSRRRRRGYNQSELLARPVGHALGIPVDAVSLRRTRATVPQVGLGPNERRHNVRGAFQVEAAAVHGRHILLIDDVLTTGATMSAAAETLLTAGALSVAAYCLARVS